MSDTTYYTLNGLWPVHTLTHDYSPRMTSGGRRTAGAVTPGETRSSGHCGVSQAPHGHKHTHLEKHGGQVTVGSVPTPHVRTQTSSSLSPTHRPSTAEAGGHHCDVPGQEVTEARFM